MYFPKSQITPNLYTNGEEYVFLSTQENYIGYYFKTSTGKYYTGRNSSDLPNLEIIKPEVNFDKIISNTQSPPNNVSIIATELEGPSEATLNPKYNTNNIDVTSYLSLKNIDQTNTTIVPYYSPINPTDQDYQMGEFRRFFCKKTNEIQYIEIDPRQYSLLTSKDPQILWQLYYPFNIPWTISGILGEIYIVNKNIVELTMKQLKLPRFNDYLKNDYLKYFI
jgi:hypothetical protein